MIYLNSKGDYVFSNVKMPVTIFIGKKNKVANWKFDDVSSETMLINKIELNTIPLSKISNIMRGLEFGRDKLNDNGQIPFITGSNIQKYCIKKIAYIDENTLNEFQKEKRFFDDKRILIRETGSAITALYIDKLLYSNRSLFSILISDTRFNAKFILGCLNSSVLQFYYSTKFKADSELFPKIRIIQVKELPIPVADNILQKTIIDIVDKILAEKSNNPNSETLFLEKQIDNLVYKLYKLTEEEIKIIEG